MSDRERERVIERITKDVLEKKIRIAFYTHTHNHIYTRKHSHSHTHPPPTWLLQKVTKIKHAKHVYVCEQVHFMWGGLVFVCVGLSVRCVKVSECVCHMEMCISRVVSPRSKLLLNFFLSLTGKASPTGMLVGKKKFFF